ncbi:cupredoxin domain-containing protein [Natronococcus wangiae]|uniref:hypothetical protein n=1 Tax=Natronococcus wangiae TaxID=3068275 RepID=UPI00273E34E3|nr:hypothetical protein [Natronococcus sp. AD5]
MEWTRRRAIYATAAACTLAGCLGDDGDDESELEEPDTDIDSLREEYDVADRTGDDPVEIAVDPDGARFDPDGLEIDASTTLRWAWEGSSEDLYPIAIPDECTWEGTDGERTAGDEYDRVFWAEGGYVYGSRDGDGEEFTGALFVHDDGEDE